MKTHTKHMPEHCKPNEDNTYNMRKQSKQIKHEAHTEHMQIHEITFKWKYKESMQSHAHTYTN